jgi:anti-sigma regulatory factor (Ser/Thr protein kinase)
MKPFIITPPGELGDKSLVPFFKGWNWQLDPLGEVVFDFSRVEFLAPWAITLFGLHALWLRDHHHNAVKLWLDPQTQAGRYLVQAGIFELLDLPRPTGIGDLPEARTVRLSRIKTSQDVPAFAKRVMDVLQIGDEEIEGAVQYSLIELLRNVVQHSGSQIGGVSMCQYYPNTGIVEIVVADTGVGILSTLKRRYPEIPTDLSGVKFAMLPHVSGTFSHHAYNRMAENAGLGLFFIKEIASRAGGGFFLGSNSALADIWGNMAGTLGKKYQVASKGGWPGTFALVQLRKDSIDEFDSLLSVCRELAAQARKDPSEVALDFIEEVPDISGLTVIRIRDFEEDVDAAARVRDTMVLPTLARGEMVVLDFSGIKAATQSFVHACMYKVLRDRPETRFALSIAGCSDATREAIRAVAAYAKVGLSSERR